MEYIGIINEYLKYIAAADWLMVSVLVLLVINLFSLRFQHHKVEKQDRLINSLEKDLRALANAAIGVGGRVMKIEREQRNKSASTNATEQFVDEVNQSMPVDFYNNTNQPYEQAIRMSQSGAGVEDIVNICGLSQSEVELICMMHRLDEAS